MRMSGTREIDHSTTRFHPPSPHSSTVRETTDGRTDIRWIALCQWGYTSMWGKSARSRTLDHPLRALSIALPPPSPRRQRGGGIERNRKGCCSNDEDPVAHTGKRGRKNERGGRESRCTRKTGNNNHAYVHVHVRTCICSGEWEEEERGKRRKRKPSRQAACSLSLHLFPVFPRKYICHLEWIKTSGRHVRVEWGERDEEEERSGVCRYRIVGGMEWKGSRIHESSQCSALLVIVMAIAPSRTTTTSEPRWSGVVWRSAGDCVQRSGPHWLRVCREEMVLMLRTRESR